MMTKIWVYLPDLCLPDLGVAACSIAFLMSVYNFGVLDLDLGVAARGLS